MMAVILTQIGLINTNSCPLLCMIQAFLLLSLSLSLLLLLLLWLTTLDVSAALWMCRNQKVAIAGRMCPGTRQSSQPTVDRAGSPGFQKMDKVSRVCYG